MYFFAYLVGGIIMLLGGLFAMRLGLGRVFSPALAGLLGRLTLTPLRGVAAGAAGAALLQSSTALTLLTVGLVSGGYLNFYQGLGLVLGANVGTCTTVGLLAVASPRLELWPLVAAGAVTALLCRRLRWGALAVTGLVAMLAGIRVVSAGLAAVAEAETAVGWLAAAAANPLAGIGGGIVLTFLVQSSSAATGLLMALAAEGLIDLTGAAYGVYGNNIGSCLSSVLVGAAAPLAAKRVAMAHVVLNVAGVLVFLPLTGALTGAAAMVTADFAGRVAVMHTLFNVVSSLAVLPVARAFAALIAWLVPGREDV